MKKARIVLSAITLLCIVGAAFAFKAVKFNASPVWRYTQSITVANKTYAAAASFCTSISAVQYFTAPPAGVVAQNVTSSTAFVGSPSTITLTNITDPAETLTIAATSCTLIPLTRTTAAQ